MREILRIYAVLFAVFLLIIDKTTSQSLEVGGGFGLSTYDGELTPTTFKGRFKILEPGVTVFARYNPMNPYFTWRAGFLLTSIRGDDALSDESSWRQTRNLSFHTRIIEFAVIGEWNIFSFYPDRAGRAFTPYLFGGIAVYNFKPTTIYNGKVIDLQPLGTEGQGLSQYPERDFYNLTQISLPVGGGLKWAVTDQITLSGEMGWRKTFTDYLDDISTTYVDYDLLLNERGDLSAKLSRRSWEVTGVPPDQVPVGDNRRGSPSAKDWYFMGLIKLSYQLYVNDLYSTKLKCYKF